MPPAFILGHGLGWVSTWRTQSKKVGIKNPVVVKNMFIKTSHYTTHVAAVSDICVNDL